MAAAEYYGHHQPDYTEDSPPLAGQPRRQHALSDTPTPTQTPTPIPTPTPTSNYPHSPAQTSFEDLPYPPYGGSSLHGHNPYGRDSVASSIATQSKPFPDPYAENIPLNSRIPTMPSPNNSSSNIPPAEPPLPPSKDRLSQRLRRRPWVCWILATIQIGVFIGELGRNWTLTGTPIAIKPSFNPMIGPSPYVQINMGGRYVICMQFQEDLFFVNGQPVTEPVLFPCPWTTTADAECTLAQHCGFSGVPSQQEIIQDRVGPNQWYRFIIPIFLHAGIVHIAFNMLVQIRLGGDMEKEIGPLRFAFVYFSSGIFGFILGGNFAARGVVSTGASGCLFGIFGLVLLDLLYTWKDRLKPKTDLAWLMVDILISFVLGLLPGLDNFAHIGGFLMGLLLGLTVLHSPTGLRQRINRPVPYYSMGPNRKESFFKDPIGFFKGRKPMWWAWWGVRAAMLACAIIATSVLLRWFYVSRVECSWCKYLSCLPVSNWCELGDIKMVPTNSTGGS